MLLQTPRSSTTSATPTGGLVVPPSPSWTPPPGCTTATPWWLPAAADQAWIAEQFGLSCDFRPIHLNGLPHGPGCYVWCVETGGGLGGWYVGQAGARAGLASRCGYEASVLSAAEGWSHGLARAAQHLGAALAASTVTGTGRASTDLADGLSHSELASLRAYLAATPAHRAAEAVLLRVGAHLCPWPVNSAGAELTRTRGVLEPAARVVADLARARRRGTVPATLPLLNGAGLTAALAATGLQLHDLDAPSQERGLVVWFDGRTPGAHLSAQRGVLALTAAEDPRAQVDDDWTGSHPLAQLLHDRKAWALSAPVRRATGARAAAARAATLDKLTRRRRRAAAEWLARTKPLTAAAAIGVRATVHGGATSAPYTRTSAWTSGSRRPADDLSDAAVAVLGGRD